MPHPLQIIPLHARSLHCLKHCARFRFTDLARLVTTPPHIQNILITGASSGIGKVTCLHLAERGYTVIGSSRSLERLANLFDEAEERRLKVYGVELDMNSDDSVESVMPPLDLPVRIHRRSGKQRGFRGVGTRPEPIHRRAEDPVRGQLLRSGQDDSRRLAHYDRTWRR